MILNCKVHVNDSMEIEEAEKLSELGVKTEFDCAWRDENIDITNAVALHVFEVRDDVSDSCREADGMATILFDNESFITNIPIELLANWWRLKRQDIVVNYEDGQLFLSL